MNPKDYLLASYSFKEEKGGDNLWVYQLSYGKCLVMRISKMGGVDILLFNNGKETSVCLSFDNKIEEHINNVNLCIEECKM